jgi:hypothetical protein
MNKLLIQLVAVYLFWFTIVFILAVGFSDLSFLKQGTFLGDALIRRPYQIDFELMFTALFLVWGIFLWKASSDLEQNRTFIHFSACALFTHGVVFVILGFTKPEILSHMLLDSVWWLLAGILLFKVYKKLTKLA